MPDLRLYSGPTKLVLAFDIGTTYSGVSYCILEPHRIPEVLAVTKFPAQGTARVDARVPSLLYYDKSGTVRAAGDEVLAPAVIQTAQAEGWMKAEWWKLHLCPNLTSPDLPPLPFSKSAVDVLTDFIKYLFNCCKMYIRECHPAFSWSSALHSIEYILTYPGGWDDQRHLYCRAIERAGLVPSISEGQPRVHMLTDNEAGLHSYVPRLLNERTVNLTVPQGVVIIDAGGGIIDLSMFSLSMTSNPISCKEIAPAEYRLQGSIFVTCRARTLMERKLEGWEHSGARDIAQFTHEFDQTTKLVIEGDREPAYVRVGNRRTNSAKYCISSGLLQLSGEEATSLFGESISAIIDAFQSQQKSAATPITMAFLVGGFSASDWLWSQLKSYFTARNIVIYRLDSHINKAVTNGAVLSYIGRDNRLVAPKPVRPAYDMIERDLWRTKAENAALQKSLESLRVREKSLNTRISGLEDENNSLNLAIKSFQAILCAEALYAQGRVEDAAASLIKMLNTAPETVRNNEPIVEFTQRCVSTLEKKGREASSAKNYDEAVVAYSTVLSLSHSTPIRVVDEWVRIFLTRGSANEAFCAAAQFKVPKFVICRAICDTLERGDRIIEAITCYRQIDRELVGNLSLKDERARWEPDFLRRCIERLGKLGDRAMDSQNYNAAAEHFSTMLSLDPPNRVDILIKRCKARVLLNSWERALSDADEVIKLDPSYYQGYELRHAALHGAQHYAEAVEAFSTMLSKLDASPDLGFRRVRRQYVDARPIIRKIVRQTIRHMPRVLIDTATGCLYDKQQQADAFEALPVYNELVSSMTTQLDDARIKGAVDGFYRYVMLSHKWEHGEPLLQDVKNMSIYDLEASPANTKLRRFCSLVHSLGFQWAWSDNSCVDKLSNVVLQESLVAMFRWYRGSSLTIVYLRGVWSGSQVPGDLSMSIWNTRAWTYQEYVAAETIQFYTEDWKPYLGLNMFNHKESPVIISEMQQVTGVSAQEMAVLCPGLDRVREKLYLASRRETTFVEDAAYSLFGIFGVVLPVIYGEGNHAVGRLLEHILTGSGDVTLLAWTGKAGSYHSCLPTDLTVFDPLVPPHIPRPIKKAEMDRALVASQSSLADLSVVKILYNRLKNLPSPSLVAKRLRLPGIVFPLNGTELGLAPGSNSMRNVHVYRLITPIFRDLEIKTVHNLTGKEGLCLVHPWIRPLLDQEFSGGGAMLDEGTQALRFVARLRQPFGALLFEKLSSVRYRRVAADSLIMARIREGAPLAQLINNVCTIEVQ